VSNQTFLYSTDAPEKPLYHECHDESFALAERGYLLAFAEAGMNPEDDEAAAFSKPTPWPLWVSVGLWGLPGRG